MLEILVSYIVRGLDMTGFSQVIVITDSLPSSKRRAIEGAVKVALARKLPIGTRCKVMHHDSRSCYGLQVADYVTWAIGKKWERDDTRSYDLIQSAVHSEFEVFYRGTTLSYAYPP
jgi:hypothetical protein